MEILDLAVSLRDSLPDSGRSCQHTVWWCGCAGEGCGGAGMCVRCVDVCGVGLGNVLGVM